MDIENNNEKMNIQVPCVNCGKIHNVRVYYNDWVAWRNGEKLVQEAFPYLTPEKRELLISRICPKCWDEMFGQF